MCVFVCVKSLVIYLLNERCLSIEWSGSLRYHTHSPIIIVLLAISKLYVELPYRFYINQPSLFVALPIILFAPSMTHHKNSAMTITLRSRDIVRELNCAIGCINLLLFDNQHPFGFVLHSTSTSCWVNGCFLWLGNFPDILCFFLGKIENSSLINGGLKMEHSTSLFFSVNLHPRKLIFHSTIILCRFGGCFFALEILFVF